MIKHGLTKRGTQKYYCIVRIANQDKLYEVQFDVVLYDQVESAELDKMWIFLQNNQNQKINQQGYLS